MLALVTGAAGFIGSTLSERLLELGWRVRGVDSFSDYYPRWIKERNLTDLVGQDSFELIETDLETAPADDLLEGVGAVFHLAAQAGVRASWGEEFRIYTDTNILATQRLLEASRKRSLTRFVFASSSSVYGDALSLPTSEESGFAPVSPYGVSKLAGDQLCRLYFRNFDLPTVALRFFTVYGPRQRPDMAFHRFLKALILGETIRVFGDGSQSRDFTFVGDIVEGALAALEGRPGEAYNLGGNRPVKLREVIGMMERLTGRKARLELLPTAFGDVRHTAADISKAGRDLGYRPAFGLEEGLARELTWLKETFGL